MSELEEILEIFPGEKEKKRPFSFSLRPSLVKKLDSFLEEIIFKIQSDVELSPQQEKDLKITFKRNGILEAIIETMTCPLFKSLFQNFVCSSIVKQVKKGRKNNIKTKKSL